MTCDRLVTFSGSQAASQISLESCPAQRHLVSLNSAQTIASDASYSYIPQFLESTVYSRKQTTATSSKRLRLRLSLSRWKSAMIRKFHNNKRHKIDCATQNKTHSERTANFQQWRPSSFHVPTCNCQLFWSFAHQWQFVLHKYGLSNKISSRRWPKRPSSDQVEMRLCRCEPLSEPYVAAAAPCQTHRGWGGGARLRCGRLLRARQPGQKL